MKKSIAKKLRLDATTVRTLARTQLAQAAGGVMSDESDCYSAACTSTCPPTTWCTVFNCPPKTHLM